MCYQFSALHRRYCPCIGGSQAKIVKFGQRMLNYINTIAHFCSEKQFTLYIIYRTLP